MIAAPESSLTSKIYTPSYTKGIEALTFVPIGSLVVSSLLGSNKWL